MDTMPTTPRAMILHKVRDMLAEEFTLQGGRTQQVFRGVWRRPWRPQNHVRPSATVADYGGTAGNRAHDSDTTKSRILAFHVILDLDANWDREIEIQDWTELVAKVIGKVQNYNPKCGCKRLDYVSDDPFEVVLAEGSSEQIWVIQFEAEYFEDVSAFG
jgi:hypothetical protein